MQIYLHCYLHVYKHIYVCTYISTYFNGKITKQTKKVTCRKSEGTEGWRQKQTSEYGLFCIFDFGTM